MYGNSSNCRTWHSDIMLGRVERSSDMIGQCLRNCSGIFGNCVRNSSVTFESLRQCSGLLGHAQTSCCDVFGLVRAKCSEMHRYFRKYLDVVGPCTGIRLGLFGHVGGCSGTFGTDWLGPGLIEHTRATSGLFGGNSTSFGSARTSSRFSGSAAPLCTTLAHISGERSLAHQPEFQLLPRLYELNYFVNPPFLLQQRKAGKLLNKSSSDIEPSRGVMLSVSDGAGSGENVSKYSRALLDLV
jgi:hypothetical protein